MSTRCKPVAIIGAVHVLGPTPTSPYYRLTWTEPDGRPGRTTGGKTPEGAKTKAREIDADLRRATGPKALTPLGFIVKEYASTGEGRNHKTKEDWAPTTLRQVRQVLKRSVRGYENRLAMEVDRDLADLIRSQAGTRRTVRENTTVLRGLLHWGNAHGYFSPAQAEMLPDRAAEVAPSVSGTAAPKRRGKGRKVTQTEQYVREEDAPSAQQIARLGDELQTRFRWGKLAVELAAASGPRWGEEFQLTAPDVVLPKDAPDRLLIHWQIDAAARVSKGDSRRKLPKGEKTRETGIPATTITGYPIRKELKKRRKQALREQAEGINPEALMFPAERGGMVHHTSFMTKSFAPAAIAAGWPHVTWLETHDRWDKASKAYVRETRVRLQFTLTWHSLRHRFARQAIDQMNLSPGELMAVGGWENETVVRNRYYNSGQEHTDSALSKF
jgi:integrase